MKKFTILIFILGVLGCALKETKVTKPSLSVIQSGLTIDRAWHENTGGYRSSYALVTWENITDYTFDKVITIQAVAYDDAGTKINVNQRSFFAHEIGTMQPGFTGTLKIPVEIGSSNFAKMTCKIIRAD